MTGGAGRASYVLRRLLQVVPVVLAILVLNFLLLRLAPGDAAQVPIETNPSSARQSPARRPRLSSA